jgi:hypothetical protein
MKVHIQRDHLLNQRAAIQGEIQWMRVHLSSPKFTGELENCISTADVDAFCLRLRDLTNANPGDSCLGDVEEGQ